MIRIGVGLSFFEDYEGIERLLPTIPEDWLLLAVDGRCFGYHSKYKLSDNETRRLIQQRPNTFLRNYSGAEWKKRNQYLYNFDLDMLIVLDSDEYLVFPNGEAALYNELRNKITKGILNEYQPAIFYIKSKEDASIHLDNMIEGFGILVNRPRVFINPKLFRYAPKHHYQVISTLTETVLDPDGTLYNLQMVHDSRYRTEKRKATQTQYKKWLGDRENKMIQVETDFDKTRREAAVAYGF